jgi:DNA-binding transcriptional regulator LsrR (DeoR family)
LKVQSANTYSANELALLTKVARLYHDQGVRQPEIAARLSLSQSRVSRLLTLAQELGIVRIQVVSPEGVHSDLEDGIRERFGLRDVVVAHLEIPGTDATAEEYATLSAIGAAGANYLQSTLTTGESVGISSWSSTLLAVVDAMANNTAKASEIVQLQGGVGNPVAQLQATRLTDYLARLTGAQARFLGAPGVVASREVRDGLLQDQYISQVVAAWPSLQVALLGIGAVQPSQLLAQSGNIVTDEEQARLASLGAVGDVCLHFYDASGTTVDTSLEERTIGISGNQLRAVPRRIGFAGGLRKVEAIRAAAIGGWINVLVTDSVTAAALLAN